MDKQTQEAIEKHIQERVAHLETANRQLQEELARYRQKQTVLQESERQFQLLFDIDFHGVEVLDEQGHIITCNSTYQRLLGYSHKELIGQDTTIFASDRSKKILQKKLQLLKQQNHTESEIELIRKDGSTILAWRRFQAIYDQAGIFRGIVTYSRDITQRMQDIKQINTLVQALEQSPVSLMITDATGHILYVNFEFTELTGYSYEEAISQNLRFFLGSQSVEDSQEVWPLLMTGNEWRGESYKLKKEGEAYWEAMTVTPMFNAKGEPSHFIVVQEDITSRKQAEEEALRSQQRMGTLMTGYINDLAAANEQLRQEIARREEVLAKTNELEERLRQVTSNIDERLREQYRTIPLPTYSWQWIAGEFVLVDFNDAAAAAMGRIVDFLGKAAGEIFKDRPQVLADFARCFNEKRTIRREAPYQLVTTGETRYFVTTYNFAPPTLVIVYIQDITEYKQAEAEWRQSRERLEALIASQSAEVIKTSQAWQYETTKREQVEQALNQTRAELQQYHRQIEALVEERTAELAARNEELQRELARQEQSEESLRKVRLRLKAQYKGIPLPTYSWQRVGQDFVLVDYNDAAAKTGQGRIADFMGKTVNEIFKERPQVLADFARCFNEKTTVRREGPYRLLTTGETRYFVTTYNFVLPNLIIVYIEDITEYKRIEEALLASEEQLDLRWRLSPEARLTYVNNAYCWYFNREQEELIGQGISFIVDEDHKKVQAHLASLSPENPAGSIEYRVTKPNGAIRWQQWLNQAVFDRQGRLIEIQGMGRDITRSKVAAQK